MEPTQPKPRFVTAIVQDLNPKLQDYFDKLLRFLPMLVRQVHPSSKHEPLVIEAGAFPYMGMFYNFLIRKEIYNLMGEETIDVRTSKVLKELVDYYSLPCDDEKWLVLAEKPKPVPSSVDEGNDNPVDTEKKLLKCTPSDDDESENDDKKECPVDHEQAQKFLDSYRKFRDPKNATADITEDIFNTVALFSIRFGEPVLPFNPKFLNMDNIKNVLKHVATFDRSHILPNQPVGCEYFRGEANYILNDILLQINTSVHHFKIKIAKCRKHMYQLFLYALGVFINEGKEIRNFKIYNPLLGFEYFYKIPHLDFEEFLELVKEVKPL